MHGNHRQSDRAILLVEDNQDDQELTLRALRKANVANEVIIAHDGAEALEVLDHFFSAGRTPLGLVLLDLKLPKIDGLEVLRRIRIDERMRFVPVVILTSSAEQEDIIAGYRNGANAYVRKPVVFADFANAVRALGMFWLLLNEPAPIITGPPTQGAISSQ